MGLSGSKSILLMLLIVLIVNKRSPSMEKRAAVGSMEGLRDVRAFLRAK